MDLDFIRENVKEFSEKEIMPLSKKIDEDDYFPVDLFKKLGRQGYLGVTIPEEYNGTNLGYMAQAIIEEEISYCSGSIGLSYGAHSNLCLDNLFRNGSNYIRENYVTKLASGDMIGSLGMTEPSAGTDALSMKTRADEMDGKYRINGSKTFITNAPFADVFLTYARTGDDISAFLILASDAGFSRGKSFKKLGMRGSPTGEIYFNDIIIGSDRIIGGINHGKNVMFSGLNMERAILAFNSIGISRRAFDLAMEYSMEREQFGKPIHEFELIQEKLAYMYTKLETSRLFAYHALENVQKDRMNSLDAAASILYASETSEYIAREALQIFGGYGYIKDFEIERLMRDSILLSIGAGTNEIRKKLIAEALVRRYKK
ncbi:acyl-CoA dehydrogenase family protein [Picrophilus oshimae]|uniref:Isovaleryl-CoA dehydrogenase n=1 Tax=Picrophilus torridus (strain ATCC 700027 / DSM 9790 / JCM 10055 / NBRC 100828 / KAW 2/3) TaxID=1122961 RepID=Q6KZS8_PICTO|nr:acyl-CoA dehydrogenase family protein [Picrophilus oshimae]AAT43774.1 isovaleryl-CoA dehydrogenase [Picrophilus oshimae DSM 9789]SMD31159.1 isovaleryl-CoA dehydrogenase [Picrophilus oshimae DSM 9789]